MAEILKPISKTLLRTTVGYGGFEYYFTPPFEVNIFSKEKKRGEPKFVHLPELDLWAIGSTLSIAIDNISIDIDLLIKSLIFGYTDKESEILNEHHKRLRDLLKDRSIIKKVNTYDGV